MLVSANFSAGRNLIVVLTIAVLVSGCKTDMALRPFSSDGCSLFPDKALIGTDDWCSCCFEHDIAYWRGGTRAQRDAADLALRQCVADKTGNEQFAALMYRGVRAGGSAYFYTWYRWGYGWPFERKYEALSPAENALADRLLQQYVDSEPAPVCAI